MLSKRLRSRTIATTAALAVVVAAATFASTSPAHAGPIGDLLTRHRQARQMRLPPVDKPHTIRTYKDPNARTASLTRRFQQRFGLGRPSASEGSTGDPGVMKTSR